MTNWLLWYSYSKLSFLATIQYKHNEIQLIKCQAVLVMTNIFVRLLTRHVKCLILYQSLEYYNKIWKKLMFFCYLNNYPIFWSSYLPSNWWCSVSNARQTIINLWPVPFSLRLCQRKDFQMQQWKMSTSRELHLGGFFQRELFPLPAAELLWPLWVA